MKDIVKHIIKYLLEQPEIKEMVYEELDKVDSEICSKVEKQAIKTSLSPKLRSPQ